MNKQAIKKIKSIYKEYKGHITFEDIENPISPSQQFSAIAFLHGLLIDKSKEFIRSEDGVLFLGPFDLFREPTEEDVKVAMAYGLHVFEHSTGFTMSVPFI